MLQAACSFLPSPTLQSEVELRRYRESLGLPDVTGATGAVIPLNDVREQQQGALGELSSVGQCGLAH
jgi:hypothetical protein